MEITFAIKFRFIDSYRTAQSGDLRSEQTGLCCPPASELLPKRPKRVDVARIINSTFGGNQSKQLGLNEFDFIQER